MRTKTTTTGALAAAIGLIALLAAAIAPPSAPAAPGDLTPAGAARVAHVIDGDTVRLDNDEEVRLVGIQAPKLSLGRPDVADWPLADRAKAALETLVLGREVRLFHGGRARDRHGRLLAHLYDADGRWIQGAMLSMGLARVYTFRDNVAKVADMLALERAARAAAAGIWSHRFYRVRDSDDLAGDIGSFQLVEGRVLDAASVRGRVYLNFGEDWREDFTVTVAPRDVAVFRRAGLELLELETKSIRVRGWLRSFNGAMIEATHPEQIEVLSP